MFRARADGSLQGQARKCWQRLFKSPQQSNGGKENIFIVSKCVEGVRIGGLLIFLFVPPAPLLHSEQGKTLKTSGVRVRACVPSEEAGVGVLSRVS